MAQQAEAADSRQGMLQARRGKGPLCATAATLAGCGTCIVAYVAAQGSSSDAASDSLLAFNRRGTLPPVRRLAGPKAPADTPAVAIVAWARVFNRAATGKALRPAVAVAWVKTLRLAAMAFGLRIIARRSRLVSVYPCLPGTLQEVLEGEMELARQQKEAHERMPNVIVQPGLSEAEAQTVLGALQRLELPFFATGAERERRAEWCVKVQGNFRGDAKSDPKAALTILQTEVEEALQKPVSLQLLRAEGRGRNTSADGLPQYEVLVSPQKVVAPKRRGIEVMPIALSMASLLVTYIVGMSLGTNPFLQLSGSVAEEGSVMPTTAIVCALLAAGEAMRRVVAHSRDVELGYPLFLPSPQLGPLSSVCHMTSPPADRGAAIAVALAAPLTVAALSLLLIGMGMTMGSDLAVPAKFPVQVAWPLAILPSNPNALIWAGVQGIVGASLALLPHSQDGRVICRNVLPSKIADNLAQATIFAYLALGIFCIPLGVGYKVLPFWWAFLMFNATKTPPTVEEEVSQIPMPLQLLSLLAVSVAMIVCIPEPLHEIAGGALDTMLQPTKWE
eukprot:TRINITY_DN36673_c0_g2_i1.p1 TRINITY_DN36673_c0_g2~~TRINITY_DN36673_c0_g2_i1.p1  ORF type:complete len:561 (+),score=80.34 TRINITY_DN36673_c0_g2_i1:85-1767(+)